MAMKIKQKYPLNNLVRFYGFHIGWNNDDDIVSVDEEGFVSIGRNQWISLKRYYHTDSDVIVDLIKRGIIVK